MFLNNYRRWKTKWTTISNNHKISDDDQEKYHTLFVDIYFEWLERWLSSKYRSELIKIHGENKLIDYIKRLDIDQSETLVDAYIRWQILWMGGKERSEYHKHFSSMSLFEIDKHHAKIFLEKYSDREATTHEHYAAVLASHSNVTTSPIGLFIQHQHHT